MKYFKLNLACLPDNLFDKTVPAKEWLDLASTTENKFPPNSLNSVAPLDRGVEMERIVGISLYLIGNVVPFALPLLLLISCFSDIGYLCLKIFLAYFGILYLLNNYYFLPKYTKKYSYSLSNTDMKGNQYLYTERNNQKYLSLQFIWSESLQRPSLENQAVIFCQVPHGAAPLGITAYPMWSKLFNDKLCRWTTAPVVLKLPIVADFMRKIGYIPAKAKNIIDTLTKKEENVGIILDGIAGMFETSGRNEVAAIKKRKGIIKIALRAGVPIVPVYGFGHTSLWKVIVDPFGLLEYMSVKLDVSITPFFGRFGWFLGPPQRIAVCMCMGEPIRCPKIEEPTQEDIDKYHSELLKSFEQVFEQHKEAYGWKDKTLKFT